MISRWGSMFMARLQTGGQASSESAESRGGDSVPESLQEETQLISRGVAVYAGEDAAVYEGSFGRFRGLAVRGAGRLNRET